MDSLEALNIIKNNKGEAFCEAYEEPLNAIEKDLKRFKLIEEDYYSLNKQYEEIEFENVSLKNQLLSLELDTCIPELRKENTKLLVNKNVAQGIAIKYKKALDILKDKKVAVGYLLLCPTLENYNRPTAKEYHLTQEQYELLMEVFGNDK